jgi:diazepam-binding inhibitor (GABA receptor modulating acyl-CoA-binding protein)
MITLQDEFDAAAAKARQIQGVSTANKLQIYGLFKQATEGPLGNDRPRPGFFDPTGRAKYDSWQALGSLSKEAAMKDYIALIQDL